MNRKGKKGFRIDIPRFFAYGLFSCLMVVAFFEFIKDITNQNIKLANGITSESLKSSMKHVEKGLETYETKINTLVKFYSDQTVDNEKSKEQFIEVVRRLNVRYMGIMGKDGICEYFDSGIPTGVISNYSKQPFYNDVMCGKSGVCVCKESYTGKNRVLYYKPIVKNGTIDSVVLVFIGDDFFDLNGNIYLSGEDGSVLLQNYNIQKIDNIYKDYINKIKFTNGYSSRKLKNEIKGIKPYSWTKDDKDIISFSFLGPGGNAYINHAKLIYGDLYITQISPLQDLTGNVDRISTLFFIVVCTLIVLFFVIIIFSTNNKFQSLQKEKDIIYDSFRNSTLLLRIIDVQKDEIKRVKNSIEREENIPLDDGFAQESFARFARENVCDEDRNLFRQNTDLSLLDKKVGDKKPYSFDFRVREINVNEVKLVWRRGVFTPIAFDNNEQIKTVIFTLQDINKQKGFEYEYSGILSSLTNIYFYISVIDFMENTFSELNKKQYVQREMGDSGTYSQGISTYISRFVNPSSQQKMNIFFNYEMLKMELKNSNIISTEFIENVQGWCRVSIIVISRNSNGEPIKALFAVQSIDSEKKKELQTLSALQDAYDAVNKANNAKSNFLNSMSHDIRTPMNAIINMTNLALIHLDDKEKTRDYLEKTMSSSNHLLELINEVLDMSRIESGKLTFTETKFNIKNLLKDVVEQTRVLIDAKHQNLKLDLSGIIHETVVSDSTRLQQVFMNLLSNANKYTQEGGEISIFAKETETDNAKLKLYEFVFQDNGIGMSEEFLSKIFEPFSRADDIRTSRIQGTGLGMSITKNIVSMMNGDITVESKVNEGSKFTVTFFLHTDENIEDNENEETYSTEKDIDNIFDILQKTNFTAKRVLLVEDNAINCEIAKEILEMVKLEVFHAENGEKAVEMFNESEEGFYDMIFMDIQMPVMDGYEATKNIRNLQREDAKVVPIVAMTANAFTEDQMRAKESGMNDYISKPLEINKLIRILQSWLK
jgi:signal transduction histidine kinase/ActR/RegA family two-component response regulator